jgi:hypothetical protein
MEDNNGKKPRVFDVRLLHDELFAEYAARIENINNEEKELHVELERLAESTPDLLARGDAKIRILQRTYDEKVAAEGVAAGEEIERQIQEVTANRDKLAGRAETIHQRIEAIAKERIGVANRTLYVVYPTIQRFAHQALRAYLDVLDSCGELLDEYGRETGARVSIMNHRNSLRPFAHGKGREIFERLRGWYQEI